MAELPRLRQGRRPIIVAPAHKASTSSLTPRKLYSTSLTNDKAAQQAATKRNLIGPVVLNPFRHRRSHSTGSKSDSCTSERQIIQKTIRFDTKQSTTVSKHLQDAQPADMPLHSKNMGNFKKWLKKYLNAKSEEPLYLPTEGQTKPRNRRELIDKMSKKGVYRNRGDHLILNCQQFQKQNFWQAIQESSILQTEEEKTSGICSAKSLLKLIGP